MRSIIVNAPGELGPVKIELSTIIAELNVEELTAAAQLIRDEIASRRPVDLDYTPIKENMFEKY